jgi:hypothetical protein
MAKQQKPTTTSSDMPTTSNDTPPVPLPPDMQLAQNKPVGQPSRPVVDLPSTPAPMRPLVE